MATCPKCSADIELMTDQFVRGQRIVCIVCNTCSFVDYENGVWMLKIFCGGRKVGDNPPVAPPDWADSTNAEPLTDIQIVREQFTKNQGLTFDNDAIPSRSRCC